MPSWPQDRLPPFHTPSPHAPMSVLRPKPPEDPITFTLGSLAKAVTGPLSAVETAVENVSRASLAASLGAGPLLDHYMTDRPASELFTALATARQLREAVDAVVLVSESSLGHAVHGLVATCCHPFHNHLSRGERGGRPRLLCDVGQFEPDRTAGLIDLIDAARGHDLLDRWGLVRLQVNAPASGDATRAAWYAAAFADHAAQQRADGASRLEMSVPDGADADVFVAPLLIAASLAGIDVVRFLTGGVAMTKRFLESPAESNPPLLLAAAMRVCLTASEPASLMLSTEHAPSAQAFARWWATQTHLVTQACLPNRTGSPREERPCLLRVGEPRRSAPLRGHATSCTSQPFASVCQEAMDDAVMIVLPRLDEHTLGQLIAMRLLAIRALDCLSAASDASPTA